MRTNVTLTAKELNRIVEKIVKPTVIAYFKSKGFLINEYTIEEAVGMFNVKLAKSIDQYDETKSQKSWFSEIARNSACDYIIIESRWNRRHQDMNYIDDDGDYCEMDFSDYRCSDNERPDNILASRECTSVVKKAVGLLSEEDAYTLELKMKGYSNEEIGEEFGINDGAARTKVCRARKRFKELPVISDMYSEIFGNAA